MAALTARNLQKSHTKKPTKPTEWTIRRPSVGQKIQNNMLPRTRPKARGPDGLEQVEHLLCKHAVIAPKSLNRRLLTVQTPLQIGLRKIKYFVEVWTNTPKNGLDSSERAPPETTTLACFSAIGGCVGIQMISSARNDPSLAHVAQDVFAGQGVPCDSPRRGARPIHVSVLIRVGWCPPPN